MKRIYFSVITDSVFAFICLFFILAALLSRALTAPYFLIAALTLSALLTLLVFKFLSVKRRNAKNKLSEKQKAEEYLLQLSFMIKSEVTALFIKALSVGGKTVKRRRNALVVAEDDLLVLLCFDIDGLKKTDAVKLYNLLKGRERGKIFCTAADKEVSTFCTRFGGKITVISGEKTYNFLKEKNCLPPIKFTLLNKKEKPFSPKIVLNKKRAANYFVFGCVFTLMSFFVRFNLYYIVVGCAFLLLSAITVIFGKRPQKAES